jgi:transposase-like protein
MLLCLRCDSNRVVRNGFIHNGKQNYKCRECNRQFVSAPTKKIIAQETKQLIDKLLLEKISLAGIARVAGVSEPWLQSYVNRKYERLPK